MVIDYLIIKPDGTLVEGEGYPRQVGCHELYGQMLTPRAHDRSVWRLVRCRKSATLPDSHEVNPVARTVLIGLNRALGIEEVRGAAALVLVGADNEQLPIPDARLNKLRRLVLVGNSLAKVGPPPPEDER